MRHANGWEKLRTIAAVSSLIVQGAVALHLFHLV